MNWPGQSDTCWIAHFSNIAFTSASIKEFISLLKCGWIGSLICTGVCTHSTWYPCRTTFRTQGSCVMISQFFWKNLTLPPTKGGAMHFVKFRPWNSSGTPIPWSSSSRVNEIEVNAGGEIATRWSCWTNVCAVQEGLSLTWDVRLVVVSHYGYWYVDA